jgi:hypothetical protein
LPSPAGALGVGAAVGSDVDVDCALAVAGGVEVTCGIVGGVGVDGPSSQPVSDGRSSAASSAKAAVHFAERIGEVLK